MYANRIQSRTCREPISRRALAHLRAAAGLPGRRRGGQPGNRNRLTHGMYSSAFRARRGRTRRLLQETSELIATLARAAGLRRASFDGRAKKALILSPEPVEGSKDEGRPRYSSSARSASSRAPSRMRRLYRWSRLRRGDFCQ